MNYEENLHVKEYTDEEYIIGVCKEFNNMVLPFMPLYCFKTNTLHVFKVKNKELKLIKCYDILKYKTNFSTLECARAIKAFVELELKLQAITKAIDELGKDL